MIAALALELLLVEPLGRAVHPPGTPMSMKLAPDRPQPGAPDHRGEANNFSESLCPTACRPAYRPAEQLMIGAQLVVPRLSVSRVDHSLLADK